MRKHPRKRSSPRAGCRERERTETGPDNPLVRDCFGVVPWRESDCAQRQSIGANVHWRKISIDHGSIGGWTTQLEGAHSIVPFAIEWGRDAADSATATHPGHLDLRPSNPQGFLRHPIRHP
jgi:hypothetical protein